MLSHMSIVPSSVQWSVLELNRADFHLFNALARLCHFEIMPIPQIFFCFMSRKVSLLALMNIDAEYESKANEAAQRESSRSVDI